VFVGDRLRLAVSFEAALAGLASLTRGTALVRASGDAYGEGASDLVRVGPLGSVAGVSRLVKVHFGDLVVRGESALLILRWEAVGPGGDLFPALDADLTLTPAGEQAALLTLAAVYRPPLGRLGEGLDRAGLNRVATATIRAFLNHLADLITSSNGNAGLSSVPADQDPGEGRAASETP
jgi:hypothetical protein